MATASSRTRARKPAKPKGTKSRRQGGEGKIDRAELVEIPNHVIGGSRQQLEEVLVELVKLANRARPKSKTFGKILAKVNVINGVVRTLGQLRIFAETASFKERDRAQAEYIDRLEKKIRDYEQRLLAGGRPVIELSPDPERRH